MIPAAAKTPHSEWRAGPGPYSCYLALPCDDGHRLCFWQSLLALQEATLSGRSRHRIRLKVGGGDSLIPRARNIYLRDWYVNTADDYLGFIDSDIDFRPDDSFQLLDTGLPIIAGLYGIKEPDLRWCINAIPGFDKDPATQQQRVAAAGTGFFFVHRYVIGTMIAEAEKWPHWPIRYISDAGGHEEWDLFHNGVVHDPEWFPHSPRYLSEDWGFCYMARRLGFEVVLDHRSTVLHEGSIKYPLQVRRLTAEEATTGQIQQPK